MTTSLFVIYLSMSELSLLSHFSLIPNCKLNLKKKLTAFPDSARFGIRSMSRILKNCKGRGVINRTSINDGSRFNRYSSPHTTSKNHNIIMWFQNSSLSPPRENHCLWEPHEIKKIIELKNRPNRFVKVIFDEDIVESYFSKLRHSNQYRAFPFCNHSF